MSVFGSQPTIVHVTTVHTPFDNRIFKKECVTLSRSGYDVHLICPVERESVVEGVHLVPVRRWRSRILRALLSGMQAAWLARRLRPRVIHFHDPEFLPFALLLSALGFRLVYDVHEDYTSGIMSKEYIPLPLRRLVAGLVAKCERAMQKRGVIIIAERYYERRFPGAVAVLNYPDTTRIAAAVVTEEAPVNGLLYTGNITTDRGAFRHAQVASMLPVNVTMVGLCTASLARQLEALSKGGPGTLNLRGVEEFIEFDEIVRWYARRGWVAGLALFPVTEHYKEKELTKFFEYMAAGLPILCTDVPVWKALVADNDVGICVPPDDDAALRAAIEELRNNPERRAAMGRRGRQLVAKEFNWETQAARLLETYAMLIPGAAARDAGQARS